MIWIILLFSFTFFAILFNYIFSREDKVKKVDSAERKVDERKFVYKEEVKSFSTASCYGTTYDYSDIDKLESGPQGIIRKDKGWSYVGGLVIKH